MQSRITYPSPRGLAVDTGTSLDSIFSDDFGGTALNTALWDVLNGGLGANPSLGDGVLQQAAIGSGTTGIVDAVGTSALSVNMGTTSGAERWYLSKETFAGKEDILVVLSRSQALAANSVFIGLVEVDPATRVPLLNPNLAGDFTNRGGCEFAATVTTTAYQAKAVADSSPQVASGSIGVAAAMTTSQEYLIEIDSRDIVVSSAAVDTAAAKLSGASRVSTQCPNDGKLYKLLLWFRNTATPASATTITIQRIILVDNYEQRVQVSSAEGDNIGNKALAVNLTASNVGIPVILATSSLAVSTTHHILISAATTNATSVKVTLGVINSASISNNGASAVYFKLYNKASAPTVGTDAPIKTVMVPAGQTVFIGTGVQGIKCSTGIAYAVTGGITLADTTAVAANQVAINIEYV